jgi:hypothetical protein
LKKNSVLLKKKEQRKENPRKNTQINYLSLGSGGVSLLRLNLSLSARSPPLNFPQDVVGGNVHTLLRQDVDQERARPSNASGGREDLLGFEGGNLIEVGVKEEARVEGTTLGLGMELGGHNRARSVDHSYGSNQ